MLNKYITVAFRHFLRYKKYTAINISGLSVGLAVGMFIMLWVVDELSFDKFHREGNHVYQVFNNYTYSNGSVVTGYATQSPLAEAVMSEMPEADQAVRVSRFYDTFFQYENTSFNEGGFYADAAFFQIFTFPIAKGNALNPLPDKNAVAISQSMANKFFPNEDPIGKVFKADKKHDLKVTAVFSDPPSQSSLQFNYVLPFESLLDDNPWLKEWRDNSIFTYIRLEEGANLKMTEQKLNAIFRKNCSSCQNESFLFPFEDLYLHGQFDNGKSAGGRIEYVKIFILTAFFVILMACANFTNMATAQASTRWREVGVRKVVGARRGSLIQQFLGESVLMAVISFCFAILIVELNLPFFNELTNKKISFAEDGGMLFSFASMTLLTGLLAGSFPAVYLSAVKPLQALKGKTIPGASLSGLRKSLTVFQFVLSAILIMGSIIIYQQINFIRSKNLGFEKENVVMFTLSEDARANFNAFKVQALQIPGIESIGSANHRPFKVTRFWNDVSWQGKPKDQVMSFDVMSCDENFIPALQMQIVQGRNFSLTDHQDAKNFIINEEAAKVIGLKNLVGESLTTGSDEGKIIGVVKNFHHTNLRSAIKPLIITFNSSNRFIFAKINNLAMQSAIGQLQQLHKQFDPGSSLEYEFVSESFDREYKNEDLMGTLSLSFAVIAIFISCIGLFGLVSFNAEKRSKEISIRKVMGASIKEVIVLLSKDFVIMIFLALSISFPIAFYVMDQWLGNFAYHVKIGWDVFAIAGCTALAVALATISGQAIKAAVTNPVDSLRNE